MKDNLTEQILLALARCKVLNHGSFIPLSDEDFEDHNPYLFYSIPYAKELSFFKNPLVKQLIFTIADDLLWKRYQNLANLSKGRQLDVGDNIDCNLDLASDFIPFNQGAHIEKSILIRVIYLLMGTNPYSKIDPVEFDKIYTSAMYEIEKLILSFQQKNLRSNVLILDWVGRDQFDPQIEIMKMTKNLLKTSFKIRSRASNISIGNVIHESKIIYEDELIKLWGGSKKAFNNEIAKRKKDDNEIIKRLDVEQITRTLYPLRYGSRKKKEYVAKKYSTEKIIDLDSAVTWLKTKGFKVKISENYEPAHSDCSYQYFSEIETISIKNLDSKAYLGMFSKMNRDKVKQKRRELKKLKVQHDDSAKNNRIAVIAIGGAGRNIVSKYREKTSLIQKYIFVDSDPQNLDYEVSGKNVFNINLDFKIDQNELDHTAFKKYIPRLQALLLDTDIVCIVAGLGGHTSDYGCWLADLGLRDIDCIKCFFVQTPFEFEGEKRSALAETTLKRLAMSETANVFNFSGTETMKKVKDIQISEAFDTIDSNIYYAIESLANTVVNPGLINVDYADVKEVFNNKGGGMIFNLKSLKDLEKLEFQKKVNIDGALVIANNHHLTIGENREIIEAVNSILNNASRMIFSFNQKTNLPYDITVFLNGINVKGSEEIWNGKDTLDMSFIDVIAQKIA